MLKIHTLCERSGQAPEIKVLRGAEMYTSYFGDVRTYTTKAEDNKVYEYQEGGAGGRWLSEIGQFETDGESISRKKPKTEEPTMTRMQKLRSAIGL